MLPETSLASRYRASESACPTSARSRWATWWSPALRLGRRVVHDTPRPFRTVCRVRRGANNLPSSPRGGDKDKYNAIAAVAEEAHLIGLWHGTTKPELTVYFQHLVLLLDCTPTDALVIVRRSPDLLTVGASEMARRIVALKILLPRANIPELLKLRPSLLVLKVRVLSAGLVYSYQAYRVCFN